MKKWLMGMNIKMKITKQQLKQIIKEEIIKEARDPVGPGPSAGELMGRARENFPPDVLAQAGYGEEDPSDPIHQIHSKLNQAMELIQTAYDESEGDDDARDIVGSAVDELYRQFGRHTDPSEGPPEEGDEEFSVAVDDLMKDVHSSEENPEDIMKRFLSDRGMGK